MNQVEQQLASLKGINGFKAIGIFSPQGELIYQFNPTAVAFEEVGAMANDILLQSQKATKVMGMGLGNFVHVETEQGHVFARCHNESEDFTASEAGKAHIHFVVIMESDANLAMCKIRLRNMVPEVAPYFR